MGLWSIFTKALESILLFLLDRPEIFLFLDIDFLWRVYLLVLAQEIPTVEKRAWYHIDFFLGIESIFLFSINKFSGISAPSTTTSVSLLTWRALLKGTLGYRWCFCLSLRTLFFLRTALCILVLASVSLPNKKFFSPNMFVFSRRMDLASV